MAKRKTVGLDRQIDMNAQDNANLYNSTDNWRFSRKTLHTISCRSGFKCSFPDCDQLLIGPGDRFDDYTMLGEVGHIYSGSPRGPRYNAELSTIQLKSPQNGLLLCRHHHKLIDSQDSIYSADDVNRMKHRHEWRTTAALGSLDRPLTWLESITLDGFPVFSSSSDFKLGRVNHLMGPVGSGKTAFLELVNAALTGSVPRRWMRCQFMMRLAASFLDRPTLQVDVQFSQGKIKYRMNDNYLAESPIPIRTVYLRREPGTGPDDVETLGECYSVPKEMLERMIDGSLIRGVTTRGYSVRVRRTTPYLQRELLVDVGNRELQPFKTCSSSEAARVLIDIGISVASHLARVTPVILLLDWEHIWRLHMDGFVPYIDHLFSKQALFQTIFVSPQALSPLEWSGWQKIDLQAASAKGGLLR